MKNDRRVALVGLWALLAALANAYLAVALWGVNLWGKALLFGNAALLLAAGLNTLYSKSNAALYTASLATSVVFLFLSLALAKGAFWHFAAFGIVASVVGRQHAVSASASPASGLSQ